LIVVIAALLSSILEYSSDHHKRYRWIELGKLQINTPNAVGYLYCVLGKDLTSSDAVRYDYLEFVPEDEFKKTETTAKLPLIQL